MCHYVGSQERIGAAKLERDSFPLSTYPMFSEDWRGRVIVPHGVGFTAEGERVMPRCTHFGAGGLNQVRKQIARAVRTGRADRVAQRYADSLATARSSTARNGDEATCGSRAREARIQHVEVVHSRFLFDDWFAGQRVPRSEAVLARCSEGGHTDPQDAFNDEPSPSPTARVDTQLR